jgi:hypothetical protein
MRLGSWFLARSIGLRISAFVIHAALLAANGAFSLPP